MSKEAVDALIYARRCLAPYGGNTAPIDAAIASLEAADGEVAVWQPIETAPKDGTTVIAYRPTKPPHIEGMHWSEGCWYWSYDGDGPDGYAVPPTHWMPLPSPPLTKNPA